MSGFELRNLRSHLNRRWISAQGCTTLQSNGFAKRLIGKRWLTPLSWSSCCRRFLRRYKYMFDRVDQAPRTQQPNLRMPSFELAETQLQPSSATQVSRLLQATKCVPTATIAGTPSTSAGNASARIKIANQSEMRHKCPLSPRLPWVDAVLNPFDRATRDALNRVAHGARMEMRPIFQGCDVTTVTNLDTQFVIAPMPPHRHWQRFVTLNWFSTVVEDYRPEYSGLGPFLEHTNFRHLSRHWLFTDPCAQ